MNNTEKKESIKEVLEMAKQNGYRSFENTREDASYGWVITPSNNILYIQKGDFGYGFNMSLQYVPSKNNGSGCRCNEKELFEIDINTLKQMEAEGLTFARKLKAELYNENQVLNYFVKYWDAKNIIEL